MQPSLSVRIGALLVCLAWARTPEAATPASSETSIIVFPFRGLRAEPFRREMRSWLSHQRGLTVESESTVRAAIAWAAHHPSKKLPGWALMASRVHARFVLGGTARSNGMAELMLWDLQAGPHSQPARLTLNLRKPATRRSALQSLSTLLHLPEEPGTTSTPPAPTPEPSVTPPDAAAPPVVQPPPSAQPPVPSASTVSPSPLPSPAPAPAAPSPEQAEAAPPSPSRLPAGPTAAADVLLDASAGLGATRRDLWYRDDIFHVLTQYVVPAALSVNAEVKLFPLTRLHVPVVSNLGVLFRGQDEPRVWSYDASNNQYATISDRWQLGGVYRVPLGLSEIQIDAMTGRQRFSLISNTPGSEVTLLPGINYRYLEFGGGGRLALGQNVALLAEGGYLIVSNTGQIGSAEFFPRLHAAGIEARAGVAYRFTDPWEIRATGTYVRYFYALNPEPGDPYIAGGLLDEYITLAFTLGARWP